MKALPRAKSRLAGASPDAAAHGELVEAIRADTIRSAEAADGVARVLLVTDRGESSARVLVQTRPGLNAALDEGARHAARLWPEDGVAALVGDLPALRPAELADTLARAAAVPAGFVSDAAGTGTTLLTAKPGQVLEPCFGSGSARAHARHATPLEAGPGLRLDVDTPADLAAAGVDLGLGQATASLLAALGGADSSPSFGMMRG